jgi:hypothetical protein
MKAIIFDSSTLINFTTNGLLEELRALKRVFDGKFLIPYDVKYEIIDHPLNIKRFELEALKVEALLKERIIEMPGAAGVKDDDISRLTAEILRESNNIMETRNRRVHLIDKGEAACLALNKILLDKGWKSAIAVDERTTRLLGERPENLRKFMEKRLHMNVRKVNEYPEFGDFVFIRSTELIYVAWKKGLVNMRGPRVLDALLYGLKYKGCAISNDEIEEIKNIS